MQITKTKKDSGEVVLSGTLSKESIEKFWDVAVNAAVKEITVQGFRKGNAPKERVIEEVGKNWLWKDAAERLLKEELDPILKEQKVVPIAPLSLSLKNAEHGQEVLFEITVIVPPTVTIDDYKKIAGDALKILPKDDEDKSLKEAKRAFRTQVRAVAKMSPDGKTPSSNGAGKTDNGDDQVDEPLGDDEAKAVGFENGKAVEHFIEGEAKKAVADKAVQKKRGAVAEALIEKATYEIPSMIVREEAKALLHTFKKDVTSQNVEWSEYLKRSGKTEDDLQKELTPNAEKRIALDLIFAHIVREEKLELGDDDKEKAKTFAEQIMKQGADEQRATTYAHEQFLREKVWKALSVGT